MPTEVPSEKLLSRKKFIFYCATLLFFFTSMSKVLIPGTIFNQLQQELHFDARTVSAMGSCYMYSYALSQLVGGIFVTSLGGIRVILIGAAAFAVGMLGFPMLSSTVPMMAMRVVCGFGAGVVFIGLANLLLRLYEKNFTAILGYVLVIGYLGPVIGQSPMVALVGAAGWRAAMMLPALISAILALALFLRAGGTMPPVSRHPEFIRPLSRTMGNVGMVTVCLASATCYGIYYALQTVMGRKCLEDAFGMTSSRSALLLTIMSIIVASANLSAGTIHRLLGKRLSFIMPALSASALCGSLIGYCTFMRNSTSALPMVIAYLLFAVPSGCFPLYCTIAKEKVAPQYAALAVALVNFWAFVFIAGTGSLTGKVLHGHEAEAIVTQKAIIYPLTAYSGCFRLFLIMAVVSLLSAICLCLGRKRT